MIWLIYWQWKKETITQEFMAALIISVYGGQMKKNVRFWIKKKKSSTVPGAVTVND